MANLTGLVQQHGYDGINLDFEAGFETDKDVLTTFVAELGRRLHGLGKRLTVEVSAKFYGTQTGRSGFYDYPQLGRHADHVFVMAWGWHWTSVRARTLGRNRQRPESGQLRRDDAATSNALCSGMPLYGADWPWNGGPSNPSTPREYAEVRDIAQRYGATPRLDASSYTWTFKYVEGGVPHEVWFGDATTVSRRIRVAKVRGLGLGFWRLGTEDQRIWDDPQIAPGTTWP